MGAGRCPSTTGADWGAPAAAVARRLRIAPKGPLQVFERSPASSSPHESRYADQGSWSSLLDWPARRLVAIKRARHSGDAPGNARTGCLSASPDPSGDIAPRLSQEGGLRAGGGTSRAAHHPPHGIIPQDEFPPSTPR